MRMGLVGKAHGVKGEVAIHWQGEKPPVPGARIWLGSPSGHLESGLFLSVRPHKGQLLARLEGVEDRDAAEKLAGREIYMNRGDFPPLGDGEAYLADLLGAGVFLPEGKQLGKLERVDFPAGREIWVIRDEAGVEILFPARPEFIKSLDEGNGGIVIDPPPGLVDIYRA